MATLTIADLDNGKRDLQTVDGVANSRAASVTTRYGQQTTTLYEAIRRIIADGDQQLAEQQASAEAVIRNLGYLVPVDYAPGLNVTEPNFTVVGPDGNIYAAQAGQLPFTTGTWNPYQWFPIQNDLNDHKLLVFDTLVEAQAAAATLPDGQVVYINSDSRYNNVATLCEVVSGGIVLKEYASEFLSGNLTSSEQWSNVPALGAVSAEKEAASNAQSQALADRTTILSAWDEPTSQVGAVGAFAGIEASDFLSNMRNTVDGQVTTNVLWTESETTDTQRLIKALTSIPSGHVFGRFSLFNATGVNIVSRPVIVRPTYIGHASVGYTEKVFNGITFFVGTVGGDWVSSLKQTRYSGTMRTLTTRLQDEKVLISEPYPRLAFNTSPSGTGAFPTYIANGRVIQGDDANPYFISSAYITVDGRFVVVPHKDKFTSVVTDLIAHESIWQSFHFRYVLVKDGAAYDLVGNGYTTVGGLTTNPSARTIIGQKSNGTLFVAACTGKTGESGATIQDVIDFALSEGCVNCFNLDGGGSTTFMSRGVIKNVPSDPGGERAIPAIAYII